MKIWLYRFTIALVLCAWSAGCRDYSPRWNSRTDAHTDKRDTNPPAYAPGIPTSQHIDVSNAPPDEDETIDETIDEVLMVAGCEANPPRMAVASGHATASLCEHVSMAAISIEAGDGYEVGTPFVWAVTDETAVTLQGYNGPHDNICSISAVGDIYDTFGNDEPSVQLMSCAVNSCDWNDASCEPLVCAAVSIDIVVNLEGAWHVTSPLFPQNQTLHLIQDGRLITDQDALIHHGSVNETQVYFTNGDYAYAGVILPDKLSITGTVTDLLSMSYVDSWSAVRSP